ncbi:hypothetical protein LOK49_LG08G02438 [Camellia lanceoleosa]|uniref:Uncharacterized protein n=1 Tax=Camellia lanceoleosa TaxID=1840588 RepID=A0ACC0GW72_9ERIC|nr:hypothetical protein LOK49_LG08G02438 [Camellia lanceoleosa]
MRPRSGQRRFEDAPRLAEWKIFCDVTTNLDLEKGAITIIIQDKFGCLIDGLTKQVHINSTMQGEALAIRLACALVKYLNLSLVEIFGDNLAVILLCVSEKIPLWECDVIIKGIRLLACQGGVSFKWFPRVVNRAFRRIARVCLDKVLPLDWASCPLLALVQRLFNSM